MSNFDPAVFVTVVDTIDSILDGLKKGPRRLHHVLEHTISDLRDASKRILRELCPAWKSQPFGYTDEAVVNTIGTAVYSHKKRDTKKINLNIVVAEIRTLGKRIVRCKYYVSKEMHDRLVEMRDLSLCIFDHLTRQTEQAIAA